MDGKNRLLKRKLIDANHDQVKPNKRQLILVQPQGNLWFKPKVDHDINLRSQGLGNLSRLTDEILLSNLFTLLNQRDLMTLAILSKTLFIWSSIEGIWKALYIAVRSTAAFNHGLHSTTLTVCYTFAIANGRSINYLGWRMESDLSSNLLPFYFNTIPTLS